jgi:hypothetical protein
MSSQLKALKNRKNQLKINKLTKYLNNLLISQRKESLKIVVHLIIHLEREGTKAKKSLQPLLR